MGQEFTANLPPRKGNWPEVLTPYAYSVWGNGGSWGDGGRGTDHWGWPVSATNMYWDNYRRNIKDNTAKFNVVLGSEGEGSTHYAFITRIRLPIGHDVFCQYFTTDGRKPEPRSGDIKESHLFTVTLPKNPAGWKGTKVMSPSVWGNAGPSRREDHWGWPAGHGPMEIVDFRENDDKSASFEVVLRSKGDGSTHLAFICRLLRKNGAHDVFCQYISVE